MECKSSFLRQFVLYEYGYPRSDPLRALAAVCEYLNGIVYMVFSDSDGVCRVQPVFWLCVVVDVLRPVCSACVVVFFTLIPSGDLKELCRFFQFDVDWGQAVNCTQCFVRDRTKRFYYPYVSKSLNPDEFYFVASLCKGFYPDRSTTLQKGQYGACVYSFQCPMSQSPIQFGRFGYCKDQF